MFSNMVNDIQCVTWQKQHVGRDAQDQVFVKGVRVDVWVGVLVFTKSHVQLFVTPWTAAYQAFLSLTISQSLSKFMSIASDMWVGVCL